MRRDLWAVRPLAGVVILGLLVWRVGTGPFLDALRRVDGWSLVSATGIAAVTTVCCAWRWTLVARALGLRLPLRVAVAEYYRSQFLNVTLPGGVLGDVHRGVRHGRGSGDLAHGLRSVIVERCAGQVVLVVMCCLALALSGPDGRLVDAAGGAALALSAAVAGTVVALVLLLLGLVGKLRWCLLPQTTRAVVADVRAGVLGRHTLPGVVGMSVLAAGGHVATFVIAARSAGSSAPLAQLLPLALVVLLAMALPINVGGWGPREGVAAWVFGAAGLGVDRGVVVAVVYGVMVLVASLPGAVLLLVARLGHRDVGPASPDQPGRVARPSAGGDEAAHG